jgi:hypothetical protein
MSRKPGHGGSYGYCWKSCPYSLVYKEKYYDLGYLGNSNNPNLPVTPGDVTEHTTTSGNMIMHNRGNAPGWLCDDPACGYYIRYGRYYFEV